jgi:hypothetical protein
MSKRGIVFFAINNDRIDYLKLVHLAGSLVNKNMHGIPISIITDDYSIGWDYFKNNQKQFESIFDNIIIFNDDSILNNKNIRVYRDTQYHSINAEFKNKSRSEIYKLSPYDETLLLDVDYFVLNDVLNTIWGCEEDILINSDAINLHYEKLTGPEFRLNPYGIKMFWATAIYFKKTPRVKLLFDFVEHIKNHWEFYKLVYDFPGSLFRNDYAFSIALHVLNGFLENDEIKPLPGGPLLTLTDQDQLYKFKNKNEICVFVNDMKEKWKFYASTIKGINIHCMNKLSILNNFDNIMRVINE